MSAQLERVIADVRRPEMEPVESVTPMELLQVAMSQKADIDMLMKLMDMQERHEANQARKAFNVAFSAFKSEAVAIVKHTEVKLGPLAGTKYANLFDVVNAVIPALSKHGLSHSWKLTKDEKDWMEVTCTIRHILGHAESVAMGAAPDTGPGRNAIQARGSAKSYLERYTLLAATGMAASDGDDDGKGTEAKKEMDIDEFERLSALIASAGSREALKTIYMAAVKDAQDIGDRKAVDHFSKVKNARYREVA